VKKQGLGASSAAVRHHYDVSTEFYRLWLDPSLTYSCAMFDPEDASLEQAQMRKLDYHAEEARAVGAERVLDVGCGWGSQLERLVGVHGVTHAVGLTLSEEQAKWRAGGDPRIEVRLESWEDHQPEQPYDAIISIGALEHFARADISIDEKIQSYRSFFERCRGWIRPGGWLSVQACALGWLKRDDIKEGFIAREIFPESDFTRLAELAEASEGLFEIHRVRNDRKDYERTCQIWLDRLRGVRDRAIEIVGPETTERYERYLAMCVRGWQTGATHLLRISMQRIDVPS
jgi:cyclopropane-fatty-acyl-phospholipid synthase